MQNTLVIMVKEPRAGRVKTRLARDIGSVPATWWVRHQVAQRIRRLSSPKWQIVLSVAPDRAIASPMLPALPRLAQGHGDLGTRMAGVFRTLPRGKILLIGADIPSVSIRIVERGFAKLGSNQAVIGPASDGGFWGVGFDTRRPLPLGLFKNVRWSTEHALADTLRTMPAPIFLPTLQDIDTAEDLARLSD